MQIYEVFRQEREGDPMVHVGNVQAPGDDLARQYAREVYSRRGEATRLWLVPRSAIEEIGDAYFLRPPIERSYRMGEAYRVTVQKRRQLAQEGAHES